MPLIKYQWTFILGVLILNSNPWISWTTLMFINFTVEQLRKCPLEIVNLSEEALNQLSLTAEWSLLAPLTVPSESWVLLTSVCHAARRELSDHRVQKHLVGKNSHIRGVFREYYFEIFKSSCTIWCFFTSRAFSHSNMSSHYHHLQSWGLKRGRLTWHG